MPYADLDGLRLYYERDGHGEPELLFVHGWCCDHTAFRPQVDCFVQTHGVTALDTAVPTALYYMASAGDLRLSKVVRSSAWTSRPSYSTTDTGGWPSGLSAWGT